MIVLNSQRVRVKHNMLLKVTCSVWLWLIHQVNFKILIVTQFFMLNSHQSLIISNNLWIFILRENNLSIIFQYFFIDSHSIFECIVCSKHQIIKLDFFFKLFLIFIIFNCSSVNTFLIVNTQASTCIESIIQCNINILIHCWFLWLLCC